MPSSNLDSRKHTIELKPIHISKEAFSKLPLYKQKIVVVWNREIARLKAEMEKDSRKDEESSSTESESLLAEFEGQT